MNKSFYHFILKYRSVKARDEISKFANDVYDDHSFPKGSSDYHEVSTYLELNGQYLSSMSVFDEAWDIYLTDEQK